MWPSWLKSARSDEDDDEPAEVRLQRIRRRRQWYVGGAVVLLFAAGGGVAVYRFGGRWLENRTRARVQSHLEQQDYRSAQLTLEQAVQVSPHSLTARRALAEFYEAAHSPLAVGRWREVAALAPQDDEIRLKLAAAALRLESASAARAVLAEVSPAGKKLLSYHQVAAGIALAEDNAAELQEHLTALAALEPDNPRTKIGLASLRLRSRDPAVVAGARAELERIARGENQRIHATLALLLAIPRDDPGNALRELARAILPKGAWRPGVSEMFALIEHMKAEPRASPEDAAALLEWMVAKGQAREGLLWLSTQRVAVHGEPAVLAACASAAVQLRDWRLLRQLLLDGAWGRISSEGIELAFAARVQRERASIGNAKETFADAIEVASSSLPTLKVLNRLCAIWGWPEESERVLTRVVRDFPREQSAWLELLAKAAATEKSARYGEIARRRAQALPADPAAQAFHVYAAVLTGQDDSEIRQAALAALSREDALAEELAAGLLLRWREKAVGKAIAALTSRQVATLTRSAKGALIYGAALTAAGEDGASFLNRVRGLPLLPEERALLPQTGSVPAPPALNSGAPGSSPPVASEKGKAP